MRRGSLARVAKSLAPLLAAASAASAAQPGGPVAVFGHFRYAGQQPTAVRGPLGANEYRNPILAGSYADPSIVRVGADYFLANSSFTAFPGSPIFRSRDLVHWKQVGSAIERPSQLNFDGLDTWQGNYANDLKYHDGRFYLLSACYGCGGPFLMTARRAEGTWSDPVWLPFEGIDTSIFFDDDGRAYVLNSGPPEGKARYEGHRAIWLQALNLDALRLVGPRTVLVDAGSDPAAKPYWLEGPHLIKHDGRYVLICAQGGTKERHSEVAFRADSLRGPFVAAPDNPILSQLDLDPARADRVVQAGHADFVRTRAGEWWAVFLASQPWGPRETDYNTGRETFLLPVTWTEGWPRILPPRTPIPPVGRRPLLPDEPTGEPHAGDFRIADDFTTPQLDRRWSTVDTPRSAWWSSGGGALRIEARPDALGGAGQPSIQAIRQQHEDATVSVAVRFTPRSPGDEAGLTAFQGRRRFFALSVAGAAGGGREVRLQRVTGKEDPEVGALVASAPLPGLSSRPVRLRIEIEGPRYSFAYALGRRPWRPLGPPQDGAVLSTTSARGFTGVLLGLYAYSPAQTPPPPPPPARQPEGG